MLYSKPTPSLRSELLHRYRAYICTVLVYSIMIPPPSIELLLINVLTHVSRFIYCLKKLFPNVSKYKDIAISMETACLWPRQAGYSMPLATAGYSMPLAMAGSYTQGLVH